MNSLDFFERFRTTKIVIAYLQKKNLIAHTFECNFKTHGRVCSNKMTIIKRTAIQYLVTMHCNVHCLKMLLAQFDIVFSLKIKIKILLNFSSCILLDFWNFCINNLSIRKYK